MKNLHSSMDRFEAVCICFNVNSIAIYIPVWIDLKCMIIFLSARTYLFTFQYG